MKENPLIDASKKFAVEIFNLCSDIRKRKKGNILINQLLRSGTSIGANIHEANYASGRADFINKLQRGEVTRSECKHSNYCIGRMYTLEMKCHHCVEEELPRAIRKEIKKAERKG